MKAVENGGTSIGIRCKDGVVLAVEKVISSKLLKPGANKRIATIDRHMGAVRLHYQPSIEDHANASSRSLRASFLMAGVSSP